MANPIVLADELLPMLKAKVDEMQHIITTHEEEIAIRNEAIRRIRINLGYVERAHDSLAYFRKIADPEANQPGFVSNVVFETKKEEKDEDYW